MKINLELIRDTRKAKGLNIDEMAVGMGLTNGSMYWKRENGDTNFKAEELPKVSQILGIPFEKLFLSSEYSKIEIDKQVS